MDSRQVQTVGIRRQDRNVPGSLSDSKDPHPGNAQADELSRAAPGASRPRGSDLGQTPEQLPTYNAYSADGDVTAPLVYVNYGNREDYEELDRFGISVKGAIVIARYGHGWRGVKPKVAAQHGAIGCIIYSDPNGDGYYAGDQFPAGGWRPKEGVQRGSVMDTDHPGDPLTPGVGATAKAKRLSLKEAKTITRIPVLPISYADALPLLSALTGPVAPESWRGALADYVPHRSGTCRRASQRGVQLGSQADLRCDRDAARLEQRRVGAARQPP